MMITRIVGFFLLWPIALIAQSQEATFKGSLEKFYDNEVQIFLYRSDAYGRKWLGQPLDSLSVKGIHLELSPSPGAYTVVVESKQHNRLAFPLLLAPNTHEEVQLVLASETTNEDSLFNKSSSVSWNKESVNPAYQTLRDSLLVLEKERRKLLPLTLQGGSEERQLTSYWNRLSAVLTQHATRFPQIVAENRIVNLRYLHPATGQALRLDKISADSTAYDSLFRSDSFDDFMTKMMSSVEVLNPTHYLATSDAPSMLVGLDRYLEKAAYLRQKHGLRKDFFHQYVLDYADSVLSEEVAAEILFRTSYEYLHRPEDMTKGVEVLTRLKQQYPESYYVREGVVDKQLTGMQMNAGQAAPVFAVKTLDGDSLSSTDLMGRYVYLDFWGSWCGPCVKELPNLRALATSSLSDDQLQVIGLAQDREKSLRSFLKKQPLPYPNALAPQAVDDYGITSFPTTYLISPDGIIIAKNLRGENLTQLVEEAIQSYEATASDSFREISNQQQE